MIMLKKPSEAAMKKTMTISEVSRLLNIPEHTIRYYTDEGMIPGMKRAENNYRIFDEESVEWLKGTVYFRQLGLSMKDIRHYHDLCFSDDPEALKERYELLLSYCGRAKEEVRQAEERLRYLEYITERDRQVAERLLPDRKNPVRKKRD